MRATQQTWATVELDRSFVGAVARAGGFVQAGRQTLRLQA